MTLKSGIAFLGMLPLGCMSDQLSLNVLNDASAPQSSQWESAFRFESVAPKDRKLTAAPVSDHANSLPTLDKPLIAEKQGVQLATFKPEPLPLPKPEEGNPPKPIQTHLVGPAFQPDQSEPVTAGKPDLQLSLPMPTAEDEKLHFPQPSLSQGSLTLSSLVGMALANHPDLVAAEARISAARGKLVQVGLYPNPEVGWEADELGHRDNSSGEQGPMFSQEIVTAGKLRLARAAASNGVTAADWQGLTKANDLLTRIRLAYFELLIAQREVEENEKIVGIAADGLKATEQLVPQFAAKVDVLQAQVEVQNSSLRLSSAQQRLQAAWKMLAVAVGVPDLKPTALESVLNAPIPDYDWQTVLGTVLQSSSEVQEAHALVGQAEQESQKAHADRIPNLHLKVRPFYSFPEEDSRLMIEASMPLPLFNRNQGNIQESEANVVRARAELKQVELRLTERLSSAFQRYQAARNQKAVYEKDILPNAEKLLELMREARKGGDPQRKYDYNSFLTAQRTLAQARLSYLQVLSDLWRSAVEIAGLLQEEAFPASKG